MYWKIGFWVLLMVAVVVTTAGALWKFFPSDGQTAAAWIQAVGSIMAIIGAFYISGRQTRAALDSVVAAQLLATEARRKSILAIAEAADEHARRIGEAFSDLDNPMALFAVYDKTIIDGVVQALSAVPAHEIGSRDGVMALLSLRDQFVFLGSAVDCYKAGPWKHPEFCKSLDDLSGQEHRDEQAALVKYQKEVLVKNVKVHLNKISSDFANLQCAVA